MKRFILAAGVAALAIAAPTAADPGKRDKGQSAKVERGGGGKAQARADVRGGNKAQMRVERGRDRDEVRVARAKVERPERREIRSANRVERRELRSANRSDRRELRSANRSDRREVLDRLDTREIRSANRAMRGRDFVRIGNDGNWSNPGIGCPPGLANRPWCMPPGQLKKHQSQLMGTRLPARYQDRLLPLGLRDLYRDDDDYYYRFGEGYVYRVDRESNLIASLLPLLGGGLGLGQAFPATYMNSYVPNYYQPFYRDNQDDYYRFANGYVYEIDRGSGMIENMIPLMANGYGVGQMLPAGYSAYNVPFEYRDLYYDTPDAYYRYAPGAIYQVDPSSQLITAVASLLAPNAFGIGQQLPMGYSTYNVPLAYRDQYYDTPDAWYRYNNGSIYQVDPTTQLITALVRTLV